MNNIFLNKRKTLDSLLKLRTKSDTVEEEVICPRCSKVHKLEHLDKRLKVCCDCNYHFPIGSYERIEMIADTDSFREKNQGMVTLNPLDFPGYRQKLLGVQKKTGLKDAVVTGVCTIDKRKVAIGVLDSEFLMGSMGSVVGEKIALLAEYADRKGIPLIMFSASGGARMQEGLFSLMQMAKTATAIRRFQANGNLFISVLTNPTTGGVSASFANLGDIIIAEPDALICFAGPRVIEQTIGQKLPDGFQRAEFLLEHGMIDMVLERKQLRSTISKILSIHP